MFKIANYFQETRAKKQVDQLTQERSQIKGYAGMAGNLLGTLGNDLSGGPKFAYELLQNAHDTGSTESPVNVCVYHEGEYLIWAHTGTRLFTQADVEGISNAARSNDEEIEHKSKNLGMIGYKGIGFKAVLARADRIHILSGDYSFGFDLAETDKRLATYIAKNKSIRYLWQVLPYWMPVTGDSDTLLKRCYVQFTECKSRFSEQNCPEPTTFFIMHIPGFDFETEFACLQEELSWMLFLENFSSMFFLNKYVCMARKIISDVDNKLEVKLIKEDRAHLTLNENVYLVKSETVAKTEAVDVALSRLTDYQCPQRLKEARSTVIKIALALDAQSALRALPAGQLFVGLPLAGHKDVNQRVHVQANFLLDTRRYSLTDDGPWNNFLLSSAGEMLVKFLAELAVSNKPYWHQILKVLPESWNLEGAFYAGIDQAFERIPFLPSNQDRKLLLCRSQVYLDITTSDYGAGFYYAFPKLPVKPMKDYYLYLPHRELVNVNRGLVENVLPLSILLNTLNPEYFREKAMQLRLLKFLGETPELLKQEGVLNKKWVLNSHGDFSSLNEIYIRFGTHNDDWYDLCYAFLALPCMAVAHQLESELTSTLLSIGCKSLDESSYDRLMMEKLTSKFSLDSIVQVYFDDQAKQVQLLTFITEQMNRESFAISSEEIQRLKSKKIILMNAFDEPVRFGSLEETYLPGAIQADSVWYQFCERFFKLPVISVANALGLSARTVLKSKLNCRVLDSVEYDERMYAYIIQHMADASHLQQIFHDEESQYALISLLYTQSNAHRLSTYHLARLKKTSLFLSKAGSYHLCNQLFIAVPSEKELNDRYTHLLQLSELAVGCRLSSEFKTWLSSDFAINEVSTSDFQTKFFNLISNADAKQEKYLQSQFGSEEAQQNLLEFISSAAGDRHRASIKEKNIIKVKIGRKFNFVKSVEVYTLSNTLDSEDINLVFAIYPELPILAATISEEARIHYGSCLGFKNVTPEFLARKLGCDIVESYVKFHQGRSDVFSTDNHANLILHFIIRYFSLIKKVKLFNQFCYLSLSTLDSEKVSPVFFLYLPVQYHPRHSVEISYGLDFSESFLNVKYIDWASSNNIAFVSLKEVLLALGARETLAAVMIEDISLDNFQRLEPGIAEQFRIALKLPGTVQSFKFSLHCPLLFPLISGRLIIDKKPMDRETALQCLVNALQTNWGENRKIEGILYDRYYRAAREYTVSFSLIRYAIAQLIPDIENRYHISDSLKWAAPWLPKLPLSEQLNLNQEQASYLGLRCALDEMACVLMLTRIPKDENKTASQYYQHYELIFKFLLKERSWSKKLPKLKLPGGCLLLAEDDSWQPKEKLCYLVMENQRKRSPAYLKRWPEAKLTLDEQHKLAQILDVGVVEEHDLRVEPVAPIVALSGLLRLFTVTGLPYLALAKAQDETKSLEEITLQLIEKFADWGFKQAEKLQAKRLGSTEVLQEVFVHKNRQEKIFYLQAIKTKTQSENVRHALVRLLAKELGLTPNVSSVLNFLLNNIGAEPQFELNLVGLEQDMQEAGYNLDALHQQRGDIAQTLLPDFSALTVADADDPALSVFESSTAELSLSVDSVSQFPGRSKHHGSYGKSTGFVRAPSLSTIAGISFWQVGSQEPRSQPKDRVYSGDVEPISDSQWTPVDLDGMKPHQLNQLTNVSTVKSDPMVVRPGQLTIKLDRVQPIEIPPLRAPSIASQRLEDFLNRMMSGIQFSDLEDGIGYWGEALVYSWLLSCKYGAKFTEPVVYPIAPGHSILTGTVRQKQDPHAPRLSRTYHLIWHREAGQRQAAHDFTVVKTYDESKEQKATVHEVKTTKCSKREAATLVRAKVSRNQLSELAFYADRYRLYRVYGAGQPGAELEYLRDPAALIQKGELLVQSFGL